jgi:hypothetical protein
LFLSGELYDIFGCRFVRQTAAKFKVIPGCFRLLQVASGVTPRKLNIFGAFDGITGASTNIANFMLSATAANTVFNLV